MFQTIVDYTTKNDGYLKNGPLHVKGLMLHSTATPGVMAREFRERFNRPGLGKSVHGFLDDAYYVQCLPYDKKAGHCLYGANGTHIGIELCEPVQWRTDADYFAKVYDNAVQLFAQLCDTFHLTEREIIDHAEGYRRGIASNHSDVGHWFPLFGKSMDDFRMAVGERLSAAQAQGGGTDKERIKALQRALNRAYGAGLAIDGILGPKTSAAIGAHLLRHREGRALPQGEYVRWVQKRLLDKGYCCGATKADGKYGSNTAAAVKQLQQAAAIAVDGIVGLHTAKALLA